MELSIPSQNLILLVSVKDLLVLPVDLDFGEIGAKGEILENLVLLEIEEKKERREKLENLEEMDLQE